MKDLKPTQLLRLLAVAVLLSFLAACSDDDDKPAYGTLDSLFQNSTIKGCQTCHDGSDDGPDLSKSSFSSALKNKYSNDYSGWTVTNTCSNKSNSNHSPYITAGLPNQSAVLETISQTYGNKTSCGTLNEHETGYAVLSGSILDEFVTWIQNGAK